MINFSLQIVNLPILLLDDLRHGVNQAREVTARRDAERLHASGLGRVNAIRGHILVARDLILVHRGSVLFLIASVYHHISSSLASPELSLPLIEFISSLTIDLISATSLR